MIRVWSRPLRPWGLAAAMAILPLLGHAQVDSKEIASVDWHDIVAALSGLEMDQPWSSQSAVSGG
jgi:hypothetical protein